MSGPTILHLDNSVQFRPIKIKEVKLLKLITDKRCARYLISVSQHWTMQTRL